MKKKILFILFVQLLVGVPALTAQSKKMVANWQRTIASLEQTEFTADLRRIKEQIEGDVAFFKRWSASQSKPAAEMEEFRKSYQATVERFDAVLEILRNDFMNPSRREELKLRPNTDHLQKEAAEALQFYRNELKEKMDTYMGDDAFPTFGITEIGLLISVTKEILQLVDKWNAKMAEMSGKYFEDNYLSKLRLKAWEEY